jgi:hypothetical protein
MQRVVAPGGVILLFDFRYPNPFNPDVAGISIEELRPLFANWSMTEKTLILLPPLARVVCRWSQNLCRRMEDALPPLRSHFVLSFRRNDGIAS